MVVAHQAVLAPFTSFAAGASAAAAAAAVIVLLLSQLMVCCLIPPRLLINNDGIDTGASRYFNWVDYDGSSVFRTKPSMVLSYPRWWQVSLGAMSRNVSDCLFGNMYGEMGN